MRLLGGKPTESPWLYALAGTLMVGGPVWHELYTQHYPARPEAFLLPLLAGLLGAVVALGSRFLGGVAGGVMFGGLLFVFTDLQFDLHLYVYTALVILACVVIALVLSTHRAAIITAALCALYVTSLYRPFNAPFTRAPEAVPSDSAGRVLLHVILDEQWGVGGFRAAGDTAMAAFVSQFWLDRGFEVFEAAYSRYELTEESLPHALGLGQSLSVSDTTVSPYGNTYWVSLHHIPYFERLRELGYDIRVYQPTFVDYCGTDDVTACDVQSGNSIANIGFIGGSWFTRLRWITRFYLTTRSHVYEKLFHSKSVWRRSVAGGGVATLHRVRDAIAANMPGNTAYFVHVMLPHRPLQMDAECKVVSDASRHIGYEYPDNDSLYRVSLSAYADQSRCTHRLLGQVLDAVDSAVGRDRSIVLVHGDHGSRLQRREPRHRWVGYTPEELNALFPTLLAIRRPGVRPVIHEDPIPLQDAIWELTQSGFTASLSHPWLHETRGKADTTVEVVRPLATSEMLWVRQKP